MEHEERLDEQEQSLRDDADELERQGNKMDARTDDLQGEVDDAREEFGRQQKAEDVPGAQEEGGHGDGRGLPQDAEEEASEG